MIKYILIGCSILIIIICIIFSSITGIPTQNTWLGLIGGILFFVPLYILCWITANKTRKTKPYISFILKGIPIVGGIISIVLITSFILYPANYS